MRMSLKNLLTRLIREGKLKRQETDITYVQNLLDAAKRNFVAASLIEGKIDPELNDNDEVIVFKVIERLRYSTDSQEGFKRALSRFSKKINLI